MFVTGLTGFDYFSHDRLLRSPRFDCAIRTRRGATAKQHMAEIGALVERL
jgi:hypothetical protein